MAQEVPGFNQEPQNAQPHAAEQQQDAPAEFLAYIDRDIAEVRVTIEGHRREGHFTLGFDEQLVQFQRLRQEVENGQFHSIRALLQERLTAAEQARAASQQKLRPRGEMPGDGDYFVLKDEILTGENLSKKVSGMVDDSERAWIARSIELREREQYEHTDRGRVMYEINESYHKVRELAHLQQLIPPQQEAQQQEQQSSEKQNS